MFYFRLGEKRVVQCPASPTGLLPLGQLSSIYIILKFVGGTQASLKLVDYTTEAIKRSRF